MGTNAVNAIYDTIFRRLYTTLCVVADGEIDADGYLTARS